MATLESYGKSWFIGKTDIKDARPTMKEIIERKNINRNYYGKLIIRSDGNIYSNINDTPIGNIRHSLPADVVLKEVKDGASWRLIRSSEKPCSDCLYSLLCPPISNYEVVIGRNNLCNIKE